MGAEFEVVHHPQIKNLHCFLVKIVNRNMHLHRDIELELLLDGEMEIISRHDSYTCAAPAMVLLNSGQPHSLRALGKGAQILALQVSPNFFAEIYLPIANLLFERVMLKPLLSKEVFDEIWFLAIELCVQYFRKDYLYEFRCAAILNRLFELIVKSVPHHILTEEEKYSAGQKAGRLGRVLSFIDANYTNRIRLSDIAEQEGLSLSYLSRFFKDNMNQSFQAYVNTLRFQQAKRLLLKKNKGLLDISLQSGFSDTRYLHKAFMANMHCTPEEYRDKENTIETDAMPSLYAESKFSDQKALWYLQNEYNGSM